MEHHDYLHENTGEPNFNESMYFNFYDRDQKLGGFVRIGNRPNERYAEVTIAIYQPDGTALFNYKRPEITDNSHLAAGGMRFEVIEPAKHLRVTYSGRAMYLARPLDLEDPRKAFMENPRRTAELQLDYYGLSPMYGGEASESQLSHSEMVFARGHTEQHVRATGSIAIDGERVPLHALGLRDHSWGPRSWQSPKFYRWLTCQFDDGFGFMGSQIVTQAGTELLSGFIFKDGQNHFVNRLELKTDWADPGHYHDRIAVHLHSSLGELQVTGKVLSLLPLRNRRDGKTTRISEGMTLWRCGRHVGYGLSEYLDQVP
jgi:hypothetical protein